MTTATPTKPVAAMLGADTSRDAKRLATLIRQCAMAIAPELPLFALPLAHMIAAGVRVDDRIGTAGVTPAGRLYVSAAFARGLTYGQLAWLLLHEVSHLLYGHAERRDWREHGAFNVAGDYAINGILRRGLADARARGKADWIDPIGSALDDPRWDRLTSEEIYDALAAEQPPQPPPPQPPQPQSDDDDDDDDGQQGGDDGQPGDDGDDGDDGDSPGKGDDGDDGDGDQPGPPADDTNGPDGPAEPGDQPGQPGDQPGQPGDQPGQPGQPGADGPPGQPPSPEGPRLPPGGQPAPGEGCGVIEDEDTIDARNAAIEWQEIAVQAAQMAIGTAGGEAFAQLADRPARKLAWKRLIKRATAAAIGRAGRGDRSLRKRGRRSQIADRRILTAGWTKAAASVCCVVDSSGSMSDDMLQAALSEVHSAGKAAGVDVYLIVHDVRVTYEGWISPDAKGWQALKSAGKGRGGTCGRDAYRRSDSPRRRGCRHAGERCECARQRIRWDAWVHLTDCGIDWPAWPESARNRIVARVQPPYMSKEDLDRWSDPVRDTATIVDVEIR